ncbi:MAG: hypothetical protein AAF211_16080 [Myxococcota bacterium]
MGNSLLSREQVHAWSESMSDSPEGHQAAITRLLKDQRRISRHVEENAQHLQGMTAGVAMYLVGVIVRMFDLAGGRLKKATWDDLRSAEQRVSQQVEALLPVDEGFVGRARQAPRAQAHILDEALYALFVRDEGEDDEQEQLDELEAFKVYLMMWVATEALDANWTPPKDFDGLVDYTFTPVTDEERGASA